jgi:hypothetical protein
MTPRVAPAGCAKPRAVVQVAPFAAVVVAVASKSNWLTWAAVGLGALLALWYSLAYIDSIAEWCLAHHGFGPGTLRHAVRERNLRASAQRIAHLPLEQKKSGRAARSPDQMTPPLLRGRPAASPDATHRLLTGLADAAGPP